MERGLCMDYLSTQETAAKWGVSLRNVQRLLRENRIPGAKKYGGAWLIPADAKKPMDPRAARKLGQDRSAYSLLTAVPMAKGNPDAALKTIPPVYRALAGADIAYRRGDPEPAKQCWRATNCRDETKLSAASLATAAAISSGDYALYYEIDGFLRGYLAKAKSDEQRELLSLPKILAAVSMVAPGMTPDWLKRCDFSMFPSEITQFLLYLHMLHLRNTGEYAALLHTANTARLLCAQTHTFTWLDLYILLLAAGASLGLGDELQAKAYLCDALDLGIPCGFIMPFADTLGAFGGMLEQLISQRYPAQLAPINALWSSSFKNWVQFHNQFTKENITTILTAQEYQAAHSLVRGATYAQTARCMNLSVGRIKNLLLNVYGKLHIQKKEQLKTYIL